MAAATNSWNTLALFERSPLIGVDLSHAGVSQAQLSELATKWSKALTAMQELERGAIANPDEKRMVGHYWLRAPELAPNQEIRSAIEAAITNLKKFAADVHSGKVAAPGGARFESLLVIGIGGSALGPQFVNHALATPKDPLKIFFFDNTDPDGMQRALDRIPDLSRTLTVVISKSGGTKETRNGQLVAKAAYQALKIDFAKCFVAVTGEGSELDRTAKAEGWVARFPMWDWIGGRTSELSTVGLVPAALQGFEVDRFLSGAAAMDRLTRRADLLSNPAAMLAAAWYMLGNGKGEKDMVVLPYCDRLELFSRYLQQLVMESLGKEYDLSGKKVHQGIAVYGNKGSTDQHAYVQQLRDGVPNFFVVFIEVLKDFSANAASNKAAATEVEPGFGSGDFLAGFLHGTRSALSESGRRSITVTVEQVDESTIGMLIALFERAVGFYASFVGINAYHQPGVEAGKRAAGEVLALQTRITSALKNSKQPLDAAALASESDAPQQHELVYRILQRLAVNGRVVRHASDNPFNDRFSLRS